VVQERTQTLEIINHLSMFVKPAVPGFTLPLEKHKHYLLSANHVRQVPILILDQVKLHPTYARIAMVENIPKKLVLHRVLNAKVVTSLVIFVQKVQRMKLTINVSKERMPMLPVSLNAKSARKDFINLIWHK